MDRQDRVGRGQTPRHLLGGTLAAALAATGLGTAALGTAALAGGSPADAGAGDARSADAGAGDARSADTGAVDARPTDAVAMAASSLESNDPASAKAAGQALLRIACASARPGAEEERAAVAKALAAALASAKTDSARNTILEALGHAGEDDVVESVAARLAAPATRHMAAGALVRNPGPDAARALRDAFRESDPADAPLRIALLAAIGLKGDVVAAQLLADAAEGTDPPEVRLAALDALARNPMAYAYVHVFWGALPGATDASSTDSSSAPSTSALRSRVWDCLLRVGDTFIGVGEVGAASDLFAEMLDAARSRKERCSAILALGRAGRRTAPGRVLEAVRDADPHVRAAAAAAIADLRGPTVVPAVARLLPDVDASIKAGLLRALGRRDDPAAAALIEEYLEDGDASVREAAREALAARKSPDR